jgi:transposase
VLAPAQLAPVLTKPLSNVLALANISRPICFAEDRINPTLHMSNVARFSTKLARSVLDAAFGECRRQLEYKTRWNYRRVVTAARFFPSSKQCHVCSAVNAELTLSERVWSCGCGAVHRRDLNAALNLEAEGRRLVAAGQAETLNARGAARKTWEARPCGIEARIPRL